MEYDALLDAWEPYIVHGKRHPGVFIRGMQQDDGKVLQARLEVGGYTNPHLHSGEERITILEGEGECIIDGIRTSVTAGSTTRIPPRTIHQLRNSGNTPLLVSARFTPPFLQQETTLL